MSNWDDIEGKVESEAKRRIQAALKIAWDAGLANASYLSPTVDRMIEALTGPEYEDWTERFMKENKK